MVAVLVAGIMIIMFIIISFAPFVLFFRFLYMTYMELVHEDEFRLNAMDKPNKTSKRTSGDDNNEKSDLASSLDQDKLDDLTETLVSLGNKKSEAKTIAKDLLVDHSELDLGSLVKLAYKTKT